MRKMEVDIRTEWTRKSIIEAFWQLLSVKKYKDISIKEIMDKAGYNRGTFYDYFRDKEDLFAAMETDKFTDDHIIAQLVALLRTKDVPLILKNLIQNFRENEPYFRVIMNSGEFNRFYIYYHENVVPVVLEMIRKKYEESGAAFDELYYRCFIGYVISGFFSVLITWYEKGKPIDEEQLFSWIMDFSIGVPMKEYQMAGKKTHY